ncbi:MAG: protoporphyrinogen oxidase [Thermaerobacterales bacterium]
MTAPRVAVVGGGITGLAAAYHLTALSRETQRPLQVTLFETDPLPGGKIRTERIRDLIIEQGPDSILAHKPWGVDLCRQLNLSSELVHSAETERSVYVVHRGRLEPLPPGVMFGAASRPAALFSTSILSPLGKMRAALEPLVPKRRSREEESLAAFLRRRMGSQAARRMAEPLLSAIHAGDSEFLSLDATFPQLRGLEQKYGSLTRGLRAMNRGRPQKTSMFVTLRRGLDTLVHTTVQNLTGVRMLTSTRVSAIRPTGDGYQVTTAGGATETFAAVLIATPAHAAAQMIGSSLPETADHLSQIPYASTAVVSVAYPARAVPHSMDASGFIVPKSERRTVAGCTWVSSKWPHAAPAGLRLLRCFADSAGREDLPGLTDQELVAGIHQDLQALMGIETAPQLARVQRWERAMPQYSLGHTGRVNDIEDSLAGYPGLAVAGAAYRGVGVPDCIRQGREAAGRLAAHLLPLATASDRGTMTGN